MDKPISLTIWLAVNPFLNFCALLDGASLRLQASCGQP